MGVRGRKEERGRKANRHEKKKSLNQVAILLREQLSVLMDELTIHNQMRKSDYTD